MKDLWNENKLLCILTGISAIVIALYYYTYDIPELITGIGKWFELTCNLSLAVFANFIFFIFQTFLPSRKKQKRAFLLVKSQIEWLYFLLSDIVLATEKYLTLSQNNDVRRIDGIEYFVRYDEEKNCGWLVRIEFTNVGVNRYKKQIEETLRVITNNQMCSCLNDELLEKMAKLQSNSYMKYLICAANIELKNNAKVKFGNSIEEYNSFKEITFYLGKLVNKSCYAVKDAKQEQIINFEKEYTAYSEEKKNAIPRQWVEL